MLNIIYEDKEMLVCHKLAGELSQGNKSFDVDMVSAVLAYRKSKGEDVYCAVINRLDRPVEGLVLFAKTKAVAARLSRELQQETFNKQYYALVCGELENDCARLVNYIAKDPVTNQAVITDGKDYKGTPAKEAILEYEVIKTIDSLSTLVPLEKGYTGKVYLVKIHLITGRFHQIRAQFANINCPIYGDGKYSGIRFTKSGFGTIALAAYALDVEGKHFEIMPKHSLLNKILSQQP